MMSCGPWRNAETTTTRPGPSSISPISKPPQDDKPSSAPWKSGGLLSGISIRSVGASSRWFSDEKTSRQPSTASPMDWFPLSMRTRASMTAGAVRSSNSHDLDVPRPETFFADSGGFLTALASHGFTHAGKAALHVVQDGLGRRGRLTTGPQFPDEITLPGTARLGLFYVVC
ncbi:hypothetical protein CHELA1G2_21352 [Hyphomicrobiales bacterium]|nr:hypothetical protein CHELA1G2_21352 [Hyphomicrobiales bacterium]